MANEITAGDEEKAYAAAQHMVRTFVGGFLEGGPETYTALLIVAGEVLLSAPEHRREEFIAGAPELVRIGMTGQRSQ